MHRTFLRNIQHLVQLYKIGKIYNPTGLKTALGSQNPSVTFELIGNTTGIGSNKLNQ
jgi:hypothetical protein